MKNTVLVNTRDNPEFIPFGFWYMNTEKALNVTYVAAHDNKRVLGFYKIIERYNVNLNAKYDKDGVRVIEKKSKRSKWVFRLIKMKEDQLMSVKRQILRSEMHGAQGVRYVDVTLVTN